METISGSRHTGIVVRKAKGIEKMTWNGKVLE